MKISSNQYYEVLTKQLAKQQESIGELQTQLQNQIDQEYKSLEKANLDERSFLG